LVAAAKFLVEATKNSFVVPYFDAVTKQFFFREFFFRETLKRNLQSHLQCTFDLFETNTETEWANKKIGDGRGE